MSACDFLNLARYTIALWAVLAYTFHGLYNLPSIVADNNFTRWSHYSPLCCSRCHKDCLASIHVAINLLCCVCALQEGIWFFVILGAEWMWGIQDSVVRDCVQTFRKKKQLLFTASHMIICPILGGISFYFETRGSPVWSGMINGDREIAKYRPGPLDRGQELYHMMIWTYCRSTITATALQWPICWKFQNCLISNAALQCVCRAGLEMSQVQLKAITIHLQDRLTWWIKYWY